MSWSVSAVGKPQAVAAKIVADTAPYKCVEPEEAVRQAALALLAICLAAQNPSSVVRVSASGSQSNSGYGPDNKPTGVINSLSISVDPVFGFVE